MNPRKTDTRTCPQCTGMMLAGENGKYKCVECGYEATEQEIDREMTSDD